MKTYTYTVYHILGIKIGCTTDLIKRMADQGFTEWEILWQEEGDYEFGWVAGDKEQEFQLEFGYQVDVNHYQVSRNNRFKFSNKPGLQSELSNRVVNRFKWTTEINRELTRRPRPKARKLNNDQRKELFELYETGLYKQKELAFRFNTSEATISGLLKPLKEKIKQNP